MQAALRQDRPALWGPILASVLLHLLIVTLVPSFGVWAESADLSSRTREKILRVRFQPLENEFLHPSGRLVDILDSKESEAEPPPDARFVSDKNRTVEEEMQARFTGPNPSVSIGRPGSFRRGKESGSGKLKLEIPESILGETVKGSPSDLAAVAPSNYLPEIRIGDETLLNTREYRYASFYIRMKRQMEATWDPLGIIHSERLGRNQYVTTLQITLKKGGSLDGVHLVQSSGNRRLDQEAIEAVRRAAPYLNPPPQLVDSDGFIHIPLWSFIVTLRATL